MRGLALVSIVACASPPPAHTIETSPSSSAATPAHWPDASASSAPVDRTSVVRTMTALHAAVEVWRVSHADECPTLQRLQDEQSLAAATTTKDDWGSSYKVVCDENETTIVSLGPDRREGTADDIVYPARKDTR